MSIQQTAQRVTLAQNHGAQFADVIVKYREARKTIDADGRRSDAAKASDREAWRVWAQAEVDRVTKQTETAIEEAAAMVQREVAEATRETDAARLTRVQLEEQAWRRADRLLKSGVALTEVIDRAAESKDLTTLDVLKGELPSLLGQPHQRQELEALTKVLDQAQRPLLLPVVREARDVGDKLDWAKYALGMNTKLAQNEIAGSHQTLLIDGAAPRKTIPLSEVA